MPQTVKVGTASAKSGELARGVPKAGTLRNNTPIGIPVLVMNGVKDGPTLYIESTVHGAEIAGIEVIRRILREEVKPSKLKGAIIGVPVGNPLAYEFAMRTSPHDGGNLWAMFPGRRDGSITHRFAHVLWTEAVLQAEYAIDIHCISYPGMHYTQVLRKGKISQTKSDELAMAEAYGVTMLGYNGDPTMWSLKGQLQNECLEAGIPCVTAELTDTRAITEEAVEPGVTGVLNVLRQIGMIDGKPQKQTKTKVLNPKHVYILDESLCANHSGTLHIIKPPGEKVLKGQAIARIHDLYGEEVEAIKIPREGYVSTYPPHSWVGYQAIGTGDIVADIFHE